jgi:hypothetical protein
MNPDSMEPPGWPATSRSLASDMVEATLLMLEVIVAIACVLGVFAMPALILLWSLGF